MVSPWAQAVTKEEMLDCLPLLKNWWNAEGMAQDAHEWFFGSPEKSIPHWLGYSLGYWIVEEE